jgi:hypothetical protein
LDHKRKWLRKITGGVSLKLINVFIITPFIKLCGAIHLHLLFFQFNFDIEINVHTMITWIVRVFPVHEGYNFFSLYYSHKRCNFLCFSFFVHQVWFFYNFIFLCDINIVLYLQFFFFPHVRTYAKCQRTSH